MNFMIKKLLIPLISAILFLGAGVVNASFFPNDTLCVYQDSTTGSSGILLPAISTHTRTIVYATIRALPQVEGRLFVNGVQFLYNVSAQDITSFAPVPIPLNDNINYTKTNNKEVAFRVCYVNYDLTLVPNNLVTIGSISFSNTVKLASTSHDTVLTASTSVQVYNTMTAGDMIMVLLFIGVIMLMLLNLFFHKV